MFDQDHHRHAIFVKKLIGRLTCYGEDGKKLHDAFTNDEDLPPPIPKKTAETGSQPGDVGISSKVTKNLEELQQKLSKCEEEKQHLAKRNQELTDEVKNYKKPKNSGNRPSSRPASARNVPQSVSEDDIDTLMENLQKHKDELRRVREDTDTEIIALKEENASLKSKLEKKTRDAEQLQREISDLKQNRWRKLEAEGIQRGKSDLTEDKLRKMAGAQLTDNNPAIAVLSDPNRPLSLGEKFSELYENEWTDAMEEMAETMSDETKVIKLLLDIVCDAYKFCLDKSDRFMDKINSTLNGFSEEFSSSETMPNEIAKTNKDYRKRLAVYVVSFLQKDFAKEMKTKVKTKVGTQTEAYIKRCVLVCWFMTVQDPKVHITTKSNEKFDEDLYKPYTKKGKHLDYLVWPALHLHEGGPLIGKGVAQGKQ